MPSFEFTLFSQETLVYFKNIITLNPEESIIFLIAFLTGFLIYTHCSKEIANYSPEKELHVWESFIWIIIFSISNLYFSVIVMILTLALTGALIYGVLPIEFLDLIDENILFGLSVATLVIIPSSLFIPKLSAVSKLVRLEILARVVYVVGFGSILIFMYILLKHGYRGLLPELNQYALLGIFVILPIITALIDRQIKKFKKPKSTNEE